VVAHGRSKHNAAWSALTLVAGLFALGATAAGCTSPDYPNCENDRHCQRDGHREFCVQRHCQQCRSGADCGAEQTCLRGRCVDGVNACDGDNDCLSGQMCSEHRCVARTECDAVRGCSAGRHCEVGHCVADATEEADPTDNRGPQCQLEAPTFDFDDNTLTSAAREILARDAECLRRETGSRYTLIGRCDSRGTTEYNLALGERRARVVRQYMMNLGVLPDRLGVSSEGSEGATGTDEEGMRRDRRVDFRLRP
jgi:outer membrane protein OmpA-like peptidoglycan-associated protein